MANKQSVFRRSAKSRSEHVGARLSPQEVEKLDALVEAGSFLNRSDAIRTAVRQMVSGVRIVNVRHISMSQAKQEILSFLKGKEEAYPSDMADALDLDYELVVRALRELRQSGEVEPA